MTVWSEPETEDWRTHAACSGAPTDWFYPDPQQLYSNIPLARRLCAGCPVAHQCLSWAVLREHHGIHAGTTPRQRDTLRRQATGYRWRCRLCHQWTESRHRPSERTYCDTCVIHRTWLRRSHDRPSPDAVGVHTHPPR